MIFIGARACYYSLVCNSCTPSTKRAFLKKKRLRNATRAIVFDSNNCVALLYKRKLGYYEIPGGGVEEGETGEEACIRECLEEIGCVVEIVSEIGTTIEYRKERQRINESHCYVARIVGEKGSPTLTDREIEDGTETMWVPLSEAIALINSRTPEHLYDKYCTERSLVFLKYLS